MHTKAVCKNMGGEFTGVLLRPHRQALKGIKEMDMPVDDVFEATKDAGRQLVEDGKMSPETLRVVSRELLPLEMYVQVFNQRFKEALDALEKEYWQTTGG